MRYQRLDLNLLLALKTLLVERNVTRAAQGLHVTQSAMSGILARLREYFGDPLIMPVGRRMELTPLGESLIEPVSDLLVRIDATLGTRPEFDPATTRRRFKVVASDYAVEVLLADVLREVHQSAPHVAFELLPPGDDTPALLEGGELDLTVMPQVYASEAHAHTPLFDDGYCLLVDAEQSPVRAPVSLAEYFTLRHVAFENQGKPFFERWLERTHGTDRRVEATTHTFHLLGSLVCGTSRVATVHARLAERLARQLPLRRVALAFEPPRLVQVMQWHKLRQLDPGGQWLRERLLAHAQRMGLPPLI